MRVGAMARLPLAFGPVALLDTPCSQAQLLDRREILKGRSFWRPFG